MFYFKKNNDVIEKYKVDFNREEVEKLKIQIIDSCSLSLHKEYRSTYYPKFIDESLIRNFHSICIGEKEYFEETKDVYLFSYDEYKPPYLTILIDRLLKLDTSAIDEILNYDLSFYLSIDDKIKLACQEFAQIDAEDIILKKEKLKELEDLLNYKELNKDNILVLYYNKLIKLINFELVDSILISDLKRVESFLEISTNNSLKKAFAKVLQKK